MITKNTKGFTLIELIVVIAIIAILAAVVVPNLFGLTEKAKESSTKALAQAVSAASTGYWGQQVGGGHMVFPINQCVDGAVDAGDGAGADGINTNQATIDAQVAENASAIVRQLENPPEDFTCTDDGSVVTDNDGASHPVVWQLTQDKSYTVTYKRGDADDEAFLVQYSFNSDGGADYVSVGGTLSPAVNTFVE
jgi:prepilin-type N-terminal cleavage/methylation domain-containing protein